MTKRPWIFVYDGNCTVCTLSVRCLRKFDWMRRIEFRASQSMDSPLGGVSWDDLQRSAYIVHESGAICEGFHAIRKTLLQLPALVPFGLLLSIPGARLIGVPAYRWVAQNRYRIGCCGE